MKKIILNNGKEAKISQWFLKSRYNGQHYKLRFGQSTLGRGRTSTIYINISGLSKDHAVFHVMKDKIWIQDKSKLGVYVNQLRIIKNDMVELKRGDIITFGVDLTKKDNRKDNFKFLSFELKFKMSFIDLTLSDDEDHKQKQRKKEDSLKVLIKTKKNGLKIIENVPKHRSDTRFSSRSSAEPSTSYSSSDDKKVKKSKKKEKNAEQNIEKNSKNEVKSDKIKDTKNSLEKPFFSQNKHSPPNESVFESPMIQIPPNSHLNKPKRAIEIDALPLMNGKRRANDNMQSSPKIMAIESQSPVNESPIPMRSPHEITQKNFQILHDNHELITKIIGWRYSYMKVGQKYTIKLSMIPPESFESLDTFKNTYTTLIESKLWQYAKEAFSTYKCNMNLIFSNNLPESRKGTFRCELIFLTNGTVRPRPNELFLIETTNIEGKIINFLAYVMSVSINTVDLLMPSNYDICNANVIKVISRCDCECLMNYHEIIESMKNIGSSSVLLNGLLQPSTLGLLTPADQCHNQCSFGKSKQCINKLSTQQYNVFWGAYNNVLDTIKSPLNKVFVTLINGYPGSGKSLILLELLIALSCTKDTMKQTKILVTAGTDEEIMVLIYELHKIRELKPDLAKKLNFIRYGDAPRSYREITWLKQYLPTTATNDRKVYGEIVKSANIIFCHPRHMQKLNKQYVEKFDVCLMNNASRMVEYESMIPVIFAPKVFLLFGNQMVKPSDNLNMDRLFPGMNVQQSMFERLYNFKKKRNQFIFTLKNSYRFDLGIHQFLNAQYYDGKMVHQTPENNDCNNNSYCCPLADFRIIHIKEDALIVNLLQKVISVANPCQYKYVIIVPPSCRDKFNAIPNQVLRHFTISANTTFNPKECDIMVIWSNAEMINSEQYSPDRLHYAMTKVKRSLFIVGDISQLALNEKWKPVYTYADVKKKTLSISAIELEKDFTKKLLRH